MKRVLAVSDFHCGHMTGLTPPSKFWPKTTAIGKAQRQRWDFFKRATAGKYDLLIVNGDAIDGTGSKSGGTELIVVDREEQADMATECIKNISAKTVIMTYGTPYHGGGAEDWENQIAKSLGCKIGSHEWADVDGCIIDIKHKIGSSAIEHGRHTPVARSRMNNLLWSTEMKQCPKANILLRGHVHYYTYCGGLNWLGLTMPALQGLGSKYGSRQCEGVVHYGVIKLYIDKGTWWHVPLLTMIEADKTKAIKI